ncbi:MAG TPA: SUMF1/EgtB/PvdO family nonheme iron enzyme, partial [Blastocatellia bacterium]|nr:SUMF1/EgtB/PvdO family nonheme iron enzyme [Blastocatellia bacterium]
AVKLLTSISGDNEAAQMRFNREAKMASRIDNPHAITIYDYGESESGIPFLAMEFIDGKALSDLLAVERTLPLDRVVNITNQIAEALSAAHAMGIVHRDLKPDNIMLTQKGGESDYVKVLDFGIAKAVTEDRQDNLTKTGYVLGTPAYMSPEQLSGENLDARSDIYSLAIMVYEMLSGRLPFEGDNPQAVLIKRITADPIPLRAVAPSVSDSIERVVMEGLARERDSRYPTVDAFSKAMRFAQQAGTLEIGSRPTQVISQESGAQETQAWASSQRKPGAPPAESDDLAKTIAFGKQTSDMVSEMAEKSPRKTTPYQAGSQKPAPHKGEPPDARQETVALPQTPTAQKTGVKEPSVKAAPLKEPTVEIGAADMNRPPVESKVIATAPGRPRWIFYGAAGAAAVVVVLLALLFMPSGGSGFALIVRGAPSGSEVFVNDTFRGNIGADGSLKVEGLEPGSAEVRVSRQGFAEFKSSVTGNKGEERAVEAKLLPLEIDVKGAMVLIPAGEFAMGSNNYSEDEKPEHMVSLPAFYIDKYEVTNAQYKIFCDATGRKPPANPSFDPTYFESKPDSPVLGITRDEAREYARWAGKRLPTEEEWEKAASWDPGARAKRQWPWGNNADIKLANLGTGNPSPVTEYPSDRSAYGVYGMAGNAYEWVDSYYDAYKGNTKANKDFGTTLSVVRGGNFLIKEADAARTTYRNNLRAVFSGTLSTPVGFRCAMSADAYSGTSK